MIGTLEMKNGHLCIVTTSEDWQEPRLVVSYWSLGLENDPGLHPIGERVQTYPRDSMTNWQWIGNGHSREFTLDTSKTPIVTEFIPIPKPKKRGNWKWQYGEWKKAY